MEGSQKRILCIGVACVDIISIVPEFPKEDSDTRCAEQRWCRGGNASNACTILSQLGAKAECLASLGQDDYFRKFMLDDFNKQNIITKNCVVHDEAETPCSCIILSKATGSRTICHAHKNLPELTCTDLINLKLNWKEEYSWIHIESENHDEQIKMLQYFKQFNIPLSVELEVAKNGVQNLMRHADFVFVGKDFARAKGFDNMASAVNGLYKYCRDAATLICPWGSEGACAISKDRNVISSPSFPPQTVVDTLGAGDTFISATIHSLTCGMNLQNAITRGCEIAGRKCGNYGLVI